MLSRPRIAIFHAFFKVKGGAEKLVFDLRNHLQADLFTGAINPSEFSPDKQDSFSQELFHPKYTLEYLAKDSKIPFWYVLKRQLNFWFNPKVKLLKNYDAIIFSGNVAFVQQRVKKFSQAKLLTYCHTPPRAFTDQLPSKLQKLPKILRPLLKLLATLVVKQYTRDLKLMDLVIANSENTRQRLLKYTGVDSTVIYPPIHTKRFRFESVGDYFITFGRLEEMKRLPLIVEAFKHMPDKKLVICSSGPLKDWLIQKIATEYLSNIDYRGIVSDEELQHLVGNCLAGIYIPVDEDFGIIQCELLAAGKPVIGVAEGGLKETLIDGKTGPVLPPNPSVQHVIQAVQSIDAQSAVKLKDFCQTHAQQFDEALFCEQIDKVLQNILS
jgi:glycosyltransferase involved in cell wall biosynthesis